MLNDGDLERCINCNRPEFPARITLNGKIADRTFAQRKSFTCWHCKGEIPQFTYYYSVVIAGGGLGSLKFPDRIHEECIFDFMEIEH